MSNRWSLKRAPNLADDLDILLGDLCLRFGFCNQLTGSDLATDGVLLPERFADAVLVAEGMNPDIEVAWRRRFKAVFVVRYGRSADPDRFQPEPLHQDDFARVFG